MLRRSKTQRSRPNPQWCCADYEKCLAGFVCQAPVRTLEARIGPRFLSDARSCTPESMVAVAPLLHSFLSQGTGAALASTRVEAGMEKVYADHQALFDTKSALLPNQFTNHIMAHMSLLRSIVQENNGQCSSVSGRRFAKKKATGGKTLPKPYHLSVAAASQ